MMTITLIPQQVSTFLQSRRGSKVFRRVKVPPNTREIDYNALPSCALELVDIAKHVWARADIEENRGALTLDFQGPPTVTFDSAKQAEQDKFEEDRLAKKEQDKAKQIMDRADRDADKATFNERLADLEKKQEDQYKKNHAKVLSDKANALANKEADERTSTPKTDPRSEKKDDDSVQQVGRGSSSDGNAL